MPHPRADLLLQMPHPGEDKVVKCPTNAQGRGGGGMRTLGIDGAIIIFNYKGIAYLYTPKENLLACAG